MRIKGTPVYNDRFKGKPLTTEHTGKTSTEVKKEGKLIPDKQEHSHIILEDLNDWKSNKFYLSGCL